MVISFVMICSCQKQDSAAEQQLAQRKTELDAREDALNEREKMADEREKALAKNEKSRANVRTIPSDAQSQDVTRNAAEAKAERQRRIQQLPPEVRALIPDPAQVTAGDPAKQKRPAPRQLGPEDLQRQWQNKLDKAKMSGEVVFPGAEAGSPTPSPTLP